MNIQIHNPCFMY